MGEQIIKVGPFTYRKLANGKIIPEPYLVPGTGHLGTSGDQIKFAQYLPALMNLPFWRESALTGSMANSLKEWHLGDDTQRLQNINVLNSMLPGILRKSGQTGVVTDEDMFNSMYPLYQRNQ